MKTYGKAAALIVAGTAGLLAGCQPYLSDAQSANVANTIAPGEVQVRQKVQFTDLPVPEIFVLRRNDIDSFQGSAMRFGSLIYDGIWNTFNTSQWYLHEMPLNGWTLAKTDYPDEYTAEHIFKKGEEQVLVQVFQYNGNTRVVMLINQTPEEVAKIRAIARAGMQNLPGGPNRIVSKKKGGE